MRITIRAVTILVAGLLASLNGGCAPTDPAKNGIALIGKLDFSTEEVRFPGAGNDLAGTLYLPSGPGPFPAVALVLGSGAADRTYGGRATAIAQHFARHGFACLTWDRPGVGQSTGDYLAQTFADRAAEALAALDYLRGRADIRAGQVGLWGHSQGGTVVPLAAASDKVAFLIEVAGWQGLAWQQDLARVEAKLRADGFAEEDVQKAVAFAKLRMDMIEGSGPFEELDKAQDAAKLFPWFKSVHRCDSKLFYGARKNVGHDSAPSWEKVHCPVLVIYGDKDTSTGPLEPHVAIITKGLAKAGNKDVMVKIFPGADHSLCQTQTGGPKEAAERAKGGTKSAQPDFVPGYLETMTAWLAKRFGPDS